MRIVVTGASGQLGSYLIDRLIDGDHEIVAWSKDPRPPRGGTTYRPVELTDRQALTNALADADPDVVIHAAAISSAETARRHPLMCEAVNVEATRHLAEWAARHDRRLIYTSTDLVFDGSSSWYQEDDPARPLLVYGRSKHAAERFVVDLPKGLVARLSLLYGPSRSDREGYFDRAIAALRSGAPQAFFMDEYRTPLDYLTAARIVVRLAESTASGMIHVGGAERISRFELMSRAATAMGIDPSLVIPNLRAEVPLAEPRPADVSLDTSRLSRLFPELERPAIEDAVRPIDG